MSIRTKPLLLEPRFSASAPLRGLLHAAWWARPSSPRPDSGKYPIRGLEGASSARGADERSEERKGVWGKPLRVLFGGTDLQASGSTFEVKKQSKAICETVGVFVFPRVCFLVILGRVGGAWKAVWTAQA